MKLPICKTGLVALTGLVTAALLAACGGGSSPCGEDKQAFGIDFESKAAALPIGKAASLAATISPESCRSEMTFAVRNGSLPPGMALVDGNVAGTPTAAGTYRFQIFVTAVDGYDSIVAFIAPRSSLITVVVGAATPTTN